MASLKERKKKLKTCLGQEAKRFLVASRALAPPVALDGVKKAITKLPLSCRLLFHCLTNKNTA